MKRLVPARQLRQLTALELQFPLLGGEECVDAIAEHRLPPLLLAADHELAVYFRSQLGDLASDELHGPRGIGILEMKRERCRKIGLGSVVPKLRIMIGAFH